MATSFFSRIQNIWPFSLTLPDDVRLSNQLVRRLSLPEHTKKFVFAIRDRESGSVVYLLATQNLSEQSAIDTENLINEVKPKVVVAQVDLSALQDLHIEQESLNQSEDSVVPTSSFEVLTGCFMKEINTEGYESLVGAQVLREIFGVGFYGHHLAAKRAAEAVGAPVYVINSPQRNEGGSGWGMLGLLEKGASAVGMNQNSLISGKLFMGEASPVIQKRICLTDKSHLLAVKSFVTSAESKLSSLSLLQESGQELSTDEEFEVPSFAQPFYLLLTDLHEIFCELPVVRTALYCAQKMLTHINKGEKVDAEVLTEVQNFRIAVEGLRIALNSSAQSHDIQRSVESRNADFSDLSHEEKCHALFARALQNKAGEFGSVVAVVDPVCLASIRRNWNTRVLEEISYLANEVFAPYEDGEMIAEHQTEKKNLLADKPVVAVGAGATAILGVSTLPKALPLSSLVKLITLKVPASIKMGIFNVPRTLAALGKTLGFSKAAVPMNAAASSAASSGLKASTLKATASAERIRAVASGMITSAEKTSLSAIRTSFYGIMNSRKGRRVGLAPWGVFGFSVIACSGLLAYGDRIECAAESIPSAGRIACLGRGLRSLHEASEAVRESDSLKIQETVQKIMYTIKIRRIQ